MRFSTAAVTVPGAGSGAAPVTLTDSVPPAPNGAVCRVSTSRCDVGIATYALVAPGRRDSSDRERRRGERKAPDDDADGQDGRYLTSKTHDRKDRGRR